MSTSHCLVDFLHTLHVNAEKHGTSSTALLTDFSKAYDQVDNTIAKLIKLDLNPCLVSWIANFLTDRKFFNRSQTKKCKGVKLVWHSTTEGVPQGTKLGPTV